MYILFINNNWRSEQRFLRPIFKSKPHTPLAFVHAQMTKLNLDHTLQVKCFCILKQVFSFSGNGHNKNLKLLKVKVCLFYKRIWMITPFSFFDDIFKNLWSVSYTPVMLHSQWHWLSSLNKGYPWYTFQAHTISWSWDTSRGYSHPLLPILSPVFWL